MTSWCKLGETRLVWIPDLADPTQNIPHVEAVKHLDVCRIADLVKGRAELHLRTLISAALVFR